MSSVPRYNPAGYSVGMEAAHEGGYVQWHEYLELTMERDALQAKLDAVTKDADRYRWLVESGKFVPSVGPAKGWGLGIGARDPSTKAELDAAIDHALTDQGRAGE